MEVVLRGVEAQAVQLLTVVGLVVHIMLPTQEVELQIKVVVEAVLCQQQVVMVHLVLVVRG